MFTSLKLKVTVISLSIGVLLLGFQNCSKIKISSEDEAGLNNGLNTDQLPDDSSTEINQPPVGGGGGTQPPVGGGGGTQPPVAEQPPPGMQPLPPIIQPPLPPIGGQPPVVQPPPPVIRPPMPPEDKECIEYALGKKNKKDHDNSSDDNSSDDNSSDDNSSDDDRGVASIACDKKDKEVKQMPKCFVNPVEDDDNEDYESTCAEANAKSKISSIRTQSFVNVRGSYVLTKESLGSSSLDEVKNFRGKLIICDMDVDKIDDTRGKIILVNSRVGSFTDHRGIAVLKNSTVDECTDIQGKLEIEGGKAVCRDVSSSLGRIEIKRSK